MPPRPSSIRVVAYERRQIQIGAQRLTIHLPVVRVLPAPAKTRARPAGPGPM